MLLICRRFIIFLHVQTGHCQTYHMTESDRKSLVPCSEEDLARQPGPLNVRYRCVCRRSWTWEDWAQMGRSDLESGGEGQA